jgi:hypothetical protein
MEKVLCATGAIRSTTASMIWSAELGAFLSLPTMSL